MTSSITERLAFDHDRCDALFAKFETAITGEKLKRTQSSFAAFRQAMQHHLAIEEAILFPTFERIDKSDLGLTHRMRLEHEQMREILDQIQAALHAGNLHASSGLTATLSPLMQQHNRIEEEMLYPLMDRALGEESAELLRQIESLKG